MIGRSAIGETSAVLLDFDGPVCNVFSGYPAPLVADELRAGLVGFGITAIGDVRATRDPLAILRWTGSKHPGLAQKMDAILTTAERKAVRSAQPTPDAHRTIVSARRSGRQVAIVSNNSAVAIDDYLRMHGISERVTVVAARPFGKPELMKPSPALVHEAIRRLGVSPEKAMFVGDTVTDVEAGRAAGVRVVGYAKTPQRSRVLASVKPEFLIDSMTELADALDMCA